MVTARNPEVRDPLDFSATLLSRRKSKLVQPHVNTFTAKGDAFVQEPQPLFHSGGALQLDVPTCAYYAMPGDRAMRRAQCPGHLPRVARVARGASHFAVRGDFTFGNLPDGTDQVAKHYSTGAACCKSGP